MTFREINYGHYKNEIRTLLRKRQDLKDKIRYHKKKIEFNQEKIKQIETKTLVAVEEDLNKYLEMGRKS